MIADIRPYARARMRSLGFTEGPDGFDAANIPAQKLESTYMLVLGETHRESMNQDSLLCVTPLTVEMFMKTARDAKGRIDDGAEIADTVIANFILASNRLGGSVLKNVIFESCKIERLAESNDNAVKISIVFNMLTAATAR